MIQLVLVATRLALPHIACMHYAYMTGCFINTFSFLFLLIILRVSANKTKCAHLHPESKALLSELDVSLSALYFE